MKPVNFSYKCPDNIEEVLSILSYEKENGQVLAGGQSLIAMLNMRLLYPKVILDIKNIESLSYIHLCSIRYYRGLVIIKPELEELYVDL